MNHCGFSEAEALYKVPFVRGLQYIHAALLSQGAHCVKPGEMKSEIDGLFNKADDILNSINTGQYEEYQ